MKVHQQIPSQVDKLPRAPRPANSGASQRSAERRSTPGSDRVVLSDLADQMRAAALHDEAHHTERLSELRERIANDRYQVDPRDVAEAILREEIQPWKAT